MPSYKMKRSLTKGDIANICLDLSKMFEEEFGGEHKFRPLSRLEGGIQYYDWPGRLPGQDKHVRWTFYFGHWDSVPMNWGQEWLSDEEKDKVVVQHLNKIWTAADLLDYPEKKREQWAKKLNSREQRNSVWFKNRDARWKKRELALMRVFLKDEVGLI